MLYVIVPVHNRADVTERFIRALAAQDMQRFTLVLVDDGCTDDTVARASQLLPSHQLRVLRGDGSLWWAGALQLAYEFLGKVVDQSEDSVLIINDDTRFSCDFLRSGLNLLAEFHDAAIQAQGIDELTGTVDSGAVADLFRLRFRPASAGESPNCLSTRGLLMHARTFIASKGFRPRLLPHYLSDYEFTLRLRRSGIQLRCDSRFCAFTRLELTGTESIPTRNARQVWKSAFSNRAKFNPKHWSAFVLMACPAWVAPIHLARIWLGFTRALVFAATRRFGQTG